MEKTMTKLSWISFWTSCLAPDMLTGDEVEKVEESEEPILALGRACLNKVVRGKVRGMEFLATESTGNIRCEEDGNGDDSQCALAIVIYEVRHAASGISKQMRPAKAGRCARRP